jgi:hypothetical protein
MWAVSREELRLKGRQEKLKFDLKKGQYWLGSGLAGPTAAGDKRDWPC